MSAAQAACARAVAPKRSPNGAYSPKCGSVTAAWIAAAAADMSTAATATRPAGRASSAGGRSI